MHPCPPNIPHSQPIVYSSLTHFSGPLSLPLWNVTDLLVGLIIDHIVENTSTLLTRGFVGPSPWVFRVHTNGSRWDYVTNCHGIVHIILATINNIIIRLDYSSVWGLNVRNIILVIRIIRFWLIFCSKHYLQLLENEKYTDLMSHFSIIHSNLKSKK